MSLRFKFILALLATSLLAVALVGVVAYERLVSRFDGYVLVRSSQNFRGDVAAYWLTYGTWDDGQRVESFRHFVLRRSASMTRAEQPFDAGQDGHSTMRDTGGPGEARALPPWTDAATGLAPYGAGQKDGPAAVVGGREMQPPFQFLLFDPQGRILNPLPEVGRELKPEEREHAVPIEVQGRFVAFAALIGTINYSVSDRIYFDAMWDAIAWGCGAAALMAVVLGLLVGSNISRSLRKLTAALNGMQNGDLRQQVTITSRDEVGRLASAFNAMSTELVLAHEKLQGSYRTIQQQAEQLREQAMRDALTGLYNRRHFDDSVGRMYAHADRHHQPLSIAIADIDFFKQINDAFSHAIGDAVLRDIGHLFRLETRASDLVARYGGEEFVFALPTCRLIEAIECCERFRLRVENHPWHILHPDLRVTISLGVTDDLSLGGVEEMMAVADQQLYMAKQTGRNRVCGVARQEQRMAVAAI